MPTRRLPETRLTASDLESVYSRDYYYGVTSGYSSQGYRQVHPEWGAWLDLIHSFKKTGTLLDLGSAYGYLCQAARQRGYRAFGIDVSRFAVVQEPALAQFLTQGLIERLPYKSACADVICLFDVLEHLQNPLLCLRECRRTLRSEGLLVGTTPDPLFFERKEETHCFERPPSFWLAALRDLGLGCKFRFSVEPYNFQFMAAFTDSALWDRLRQLSEGSFSLDPDVVNCAAPVRVAFRGGWGEDPAPTRQLQESKARLYLCNLENTPQRLNLSLEFQATPAFSTLRIRLNAWVLAEVHLTTEQQQHRITLPDVLLPCGGHHLFFDLFPGGPEIELTSLEITAASAPHRELVEGLPFDLYQRYRLAAQLLEILKPVEVLDVGGFLGDQDGHLAVSSDFLPNQTTGPRRVISTDLRQCDHPEHVPAPATSLPFQNNSFEAVFSLDVLEHIPSAQRKDFLMELDRVAARWILLGAPFELEGVATAEERLRKSALSDQVFLGEHEEEGLPPLRLLEEWVEERGYQTVWVPSGYLPRWQLLQAVTQLVFGVRDYSIAQTFNRLYNRIYYPFDQKTPCYRRLYLISKEGLTRELRAQIESLRTIHTERESSLPESPLVWEAIAHIQTLEKNRSQALSDAQFIANARQQGLELLRRELNETPLWKLAWRRLRGDGK